MAEDGIGNAGGKLRPGGLRGDERQADVWVEVYELVFRDPILVEAVLVRVDSSRDYFLEIVGRAVQCEFHGSNEPSRPQPKSLANVESETNIRQDLSSDMTHVAYGQVSSARW